MISTSMKREKCERVAEKTVLRGNVWHTRKNRMLFFVRFRNNSMLFVSSVPAELASRTGITVLTAVKVIQVCTCVHVSKHVIIPLKCSSHCMYHLLKC
jgi:hypothetical protein